MDGMNGSGDIRVSVTVVDDGEPAEDPPSVGGPSAHR